MPAKQGWPPPQVLLLPILTKCTYVIEILICQSIWKACTRTLNMIYNVLESEYKTPLQSAKTQSFETPLTTRQRAVLWF